MLSVREARARAVERAIRTGELPNLDLIHQMQRSEGFVPCFGRAEQKCPHADCRWHPRCMALVGFSADPLPAAAG